MPMVTTSDGRQVFVAPPSDTAGMLTSQPKGHSKMLPGSGSLSALVTSGMIPVLEAASEGVHGGVMRKNRIATRKAETVFAQTGGESNRVMPNRASFSSDNSGPQRGGEYVHLPTKTRVVVLKTGIGRSASGKAMCLVQDRDQNRYKVPLDSLG